jgi:uncharacterized membrane protein
MKYNPFQPLYGASPKPTPKKSTSKKKVDENQNIDFDQLRRDLLATKVGLQHIYREVKKNNSTLSNIDTDFLSRNKLIIIALLILIAIIVIIVYMQRKQKNKLTRLALKMQKLQKLKG